MPPRSGPSRNHTANAAMLLWAHRREASLCVAQRRDAGQDLALHKLQRGTTTGAAVGDLVRSVVFLASGGSVAAADDGDGPVGGGFNDRIHELLRACSNLPISKTPSGR